MSKIGVLITNLGTPDSPSTSAVRKYLREFLSDKRVVNLPKWLWQIILNLVILPTRPPKTAKAYKSIWTKDGSPLLSISKKQCQAITSYLNQKNCDVITKLSMRYGNPSLALVIDELLERKITKLIVLPLYPQYSATTTASTFDEISRILRKKRNIPTLNFISNYYNHSGYIAALAKSIEDFWQQHQKAEKLIMSFHGLPQAHIDAGDCYYKQCKSTATALAKKLGLKNDDYVLSFQSRLGSAKWISPYTDKTIKSLASSGIQSVQVVCPGFSADCLETLEEIAIENKSGFLGAGGSSYQYIPCLNNRQDHIAFLSELIITQIK